MWEVIVFKINGKGYVVRGARQVFSTRHAAEHFREAYDARDGEYAAVKNLAVAHGRYI